MFKSFKFLLQFAWINLASILVFAAIVIVGASVTGVPDGRYNLFSTYLGGFPFIVFMIVYVLAFAFCTHYLNMALSFGARRRDYFWGLQGILLLHALVCWGLQSVMAAIPDLFHWTEVERWTMLMRLGGTTPWLYPLVLTAVMALGCVCGLLFFRSKVWGVIIMVISMLILMAGMVALLLAGDFYDGRWGDLSWLLPLIMGIVLAVSEWGIWRWTKEYTVR